MNDALRMLLTLSVSGSLLALLLFTGRRLIGGRLPKALYYYAWLLVLVRLVLPFSAPINATQTLFDRAQAGSALVSSPPAADEKLEAITVPNTDAAAPQTIEKDAGASMAPAAPSTLSPWNYLKSHLLWIWLAGALGSFFWFVSAYLKFSHRVRRGSAAPDPADQAVFRQHPESRSVGFLTGGVATPMLLGLFRPCVIVPYGRYAAEGHERELHDILCHELTHYRRRDLWYKWAVVAVSSMHWFNPLMPWIRREIARACELSCDEAVIRNMTSLEKQRYGEMLLALSADRRLPAAVPATTLCEEKAQLKERLIGIMTYKKRTAGTILVSVCLFAVLAGCGAVLGGSPAPSASVSSALPSSAAVSSTAASTSAANPNWKVLDLQDCKLALPKDYAELVYVKLTPVNSAVPGTPLVDVYSKQSNDAAQNSGNSGGGFLFGISRLTQSEFEQYLSLSDNSGMSVFAKDGTSYYCCLTPTDVEYFPPDGAQYDENTAAYKQWTWLNEETDVIEKDFIARNGLHAFSEADFRNQPYTYSGSHLEIKYYPYLSINGSKKESMRLILSQPAKQGSGGIWCVERFYDEQGTLCLWFPDTQKLEEAGAVYQADSSGNVSVYKGAAALSAKDYYAGLQALCDAGKDSSLLDPTSAAKKFVLNCGYWLQDMTFIDGSFEVVKR